MAHHGPNPFEEVYGDRLAELQEKLGATGRFPEGKLTDDDEGEIAVAIGAKDGKVVIDFGKSTHWIGFTPQQAMDIAKALVEHARAAANEPLVFKIGPTPGSQH